MNQKQVIELMSTAELKTDLNMQELGELEDMVKSPGFLHYIGLLLANRQALYVALSNAELGTSEKSGRASVLQGQIKGLELARDNVLECFPPAGDGTAK